MHITIDGTPAINDIRAIQRYTYHLLTELARIDSDNDFSILYLSCNSRSSPFPEIDNSNFVQGKSKIPGRLLKLSWHAARWPKLSFWIKETPDIIHFPGGYPYVPTDARVVITTLHGFVHHFLPEYITRQKKDETSRILDHAIRESTHFVTVSETNKRELHEHWKIPTDKIFTIPLGIGDEFHEYNISPEKKAELLTKYNIPDKKILLFVGALEPHKNIGNIINAFSLLGESYREQWQLVFVGENTEYCLEYKTQISKHGIERSVSFVDYIQPGSVDLAHLYNIASIFIFPTLYEGWASPPLEAMKCGTPVVAANIPSLKESTGGHALYPDAEKPEDIAEKLIQLIEDDQLYDRLKQKGKEFASQYTWKRCAEKTLELYLKLGN